MNLEFREVNHDFATFLTLMQAYYQFDKIKFNLARAKSALEQLVLGNFGKAFVVFHHAQAVGYLIVLYGYSLEYGGRVLELDEIFLLPEARGLGFGNAMIEFVEQQAKNIDAVVISLETENDNQAAQGFYRHQGFVVLERQIFRKKLR